MASSMQRRAPARNQHWAESVTRRQRVLNIATWIAAVVTLFFGIMQIVTGPKILALGLVNVGTAIAFMLIPLLYRFGDVIASLTFVTVAFASLTYVGWHIGTVDVHPIEEQHVKVDIQIERRAKALDEGDRARVGCPVGMP